LFVLQTGKILLFSFIIIEASNAKNIKFSNQRYNLLENISDISFEIEAKSIKDILEKKVLLKQFKSFKIKGYWYAKNRAIDLQTDESIPLDILLKTKQEIGYKVDLVLGTDIKKWLVDYELTKTEGSWQTYEDLTGLQDTIEIRIKQKKNEVVIIEKKPTGTLKTKYSYSKLKWSKKLYVLTNIERKVYEGVQSVITNTNIKYSLFDGVFWLPSLVTIKTIQKAKVKNTGDVERKLMEEVRFKSFKVNQSDAVKWFSKQK
jgi:hypothetical protein